MCCGRHGSMVWGVHSPGRAISAGGERRNRWRGIPSPTSQPSSLCSPSHQKSARRPPANPTTSPPSTNSSASVPHRKRRDGVCAVRMRGKGRQEPRADKSDWRRRGCRRQHAGGFGGRPPWVWAQSGGAGALRQTRLSANRLCPTRQSIDRHKYTTFMPHCSIAK